MKSVKVNCILIIKSYFLYYTYNVSIANAFRAHSFLLAQHNMKFIIIKYINIHILT